MLIAINCSTCKFDPSDQECMCCSGYPVFSNWEFDNEPGVTTYATYHETHFKEEPDEKL